MDGDGLADVEAVNVVAQAGPARTRATSEQLEVRAGEELLGQLVQVVGLRGVAHRRAQERSAPARAIGRGGLALGHHHGLDVAPEPVADTHVALEAHASVEGLLRRAERTGLDPVGERDELEAPRCHQLERGRHHRTRRPQQQNVGDEVADRKLGQRVRRQGFVLLVGVAAELVRTRGPGVVPGRVHDGRGELHAADSLRRLGVLAS